MSHRCLTELKNNTPLFYLKALQYGHYLWQNKHAGRAILAITRALYTNIDEEAPVLREWPLPYAALKWIITHHCSDDFPGNPRISFQHQATRLRGQREQVRRARAWAVWALIRKARPSLPGDINDPVEEPEEHQILAQLSEFGHRNEARIWKKVMTDDRAASP